MEPEIDLAALALLAADGSRVRLSDWLGAPLVLVFLRWAG